MNSAATQAASPLAPSLMMVTLTHPPITIYRIQDCEGQARDGQWRAQAEGLLGLEPQRLTQLIP